MEQTPDSDDSHTMKMGPQLHPEADRGRNPTGVEILHVEDHLLVTPSLVEIIIVTVHHWMQLTDIYMKAAMRTCTSMITLWLGHRKREVTMTLLEILGS